MRFTNRFALPPAVTATVFTVAFGLLAPCVSATDEDPQPGTAAGSAETAVQVVAYYFHGHARCATCRTLEQYSYEAVTTGFKDDLANGRLEWRVVNTDEQENEHFIDDFQLVTKSLVLAEYRGDEVVRWKNLDKVWRLTRDQEGFVAYVQKETSAFLDAN